MSAPLIALDRVEKRFGALTALHGVSAEIREGEFFSLLGPSGCGKTTLLRCIAGFEQPTGGEIRIDGASMEGVPANRRPTNMVFQSYAIFPHLDVAQNVGYGLRRLGLKREEAARRVEEALAMVDLAGYGARPSGKLSGGQRQRVALARALVMRPRVLLLDEPLSALDKKLREQMQAELRRLQRAVGITFILVTHDQEEALIMSDRIAVMFDGRIAQVADSETLYRRPVSRRVAAFIGVMNFLEARVSASSGGGIDAEIEGLGRVALRADQAPGGAAGALSAGVRPELLSLLWPGESAERVAEGLVEDVVYYGYMTDFAVRLEGMARPLTVSMRNAAGRRAPAKGESVRVGWSAESVVLLA